MLAAREILHCCVKLAAGCALFISSGGLIAQDLHFSQFNEHTALVNPALCGAEYRYQLTGAFKDQWGSVTMPYRTYGVSFERRIKAGNWQQADNFRTMTFKRSTMGRLAAGFSVYNDEAGDGRLGQTQANLTLASFVPVGRESFLSLGLQGSFVQRKVTLANLHFPDQFEGASFDPGTPSGESFSPQSFVYPDLAAGLLWYYGEKRRAVLVEQILKAKLGVSAYHLVVPEQKFIANTTELLQMKVVFHGDFIFGIRNTSSAFAPSFMVQLQGPSREILLGGMLRTYSDNDSRYTGLVSRSCFGYGLYYRFNDAMVAAVMFDLKQRYSITMSYDINLSALSGASAYRGGFEISLKMTPGPAFLYEEKNADNSKIKSSE